LVVERALERRPLRRNDVERALRVLCALEPALWTRGPFGTHRSLLEATLAAAAETSADGSLQLRAKLALANLVRRTGELPRASELLDDVVRETDARGDLVLLGRALRAKVQLALSEGSLEDAEARARQALDVMQRSGDRWTEALTLCTLANALRERMRYDEALGCYRHAIALHTAVGNEAFRALTIGELGILHLERIELVEARRCIEESLAVYRHRREPWLDMFSVATLGLIEHAEGNLDAAAARLEEAVASARAMGMPRFEGMFGWWIAQVARDRGQHAEAIAMLERARELLESAHDGRNAAGVSATLGGALAAIGRIEAAQQHLRAALSALRPDDSLHAVATLEAAHVDIAIAARERAAGDLAASRRSFDRVRAAIASAHAPDAAHRGVPLVQRSSDVRFALRLVERALREIQNSVVEGDQDRTLHALVIHKEALWFALPDGARVDLRRRRAVRNVLLRLVGERVRAPGAALAPRALIDAGWPGEKIMPSAARNRLHVTITTLRNLGLREVLIGGDDGYRLDPDVPVRVVSQ
jgi:tetratricopeptide (TPR) repeat protein